MVVLARSQQRNDIEQQRQDDEQMWMYQVALSTTAALDLMKKAELGKPCFSPERTEAVMTFIWTACEDCAAAEQAINENARLRREAAATLASQEPQLYWHLRHKCLIEILHEAQLILANVALEAYCRMLASTAPPKHA